jgi:hypothetical protein
MFYSTWRGLVGKFLIAMQRNAQLPALGESLYPLERRAH